MNQLMPEPSAQYLIVQRGEDGASYIAKDGLQVICSADTEQDGKVWLHVSFSRRNRLPSYGDMIRVKDAFIGPKKKAIMVLPADSEYVNIHPFCLHLFHCLEDDPLPDFTQQSGSI